ncbi:MAG: M15 family metallopeptidase [Bacillaceae bacterium]
MSKFIKIVIVLGVLVVGWKLFLQDRIGTNKIEDVEMLVNKENALPDGYEPSRLVVPDVAFASYANESTRGMLPEAAKALEKLFDAAEKDGISILAVSGYRSYDYQASLYERQLQANGQEYVSNYVARAGESEHQTGLAMDVDSEEQVQLTEDFENTDAYKWLKQNAATYGFIIRYPRDKENITGYHFEPWHIRYVGKNVAIEIEKEGITLEEYKATR